jgi:hypothetical protein
MLTVDPLDSGVKLSAHDRIEDVRFEWDTDRPITT